MKRIILSLLTLGIVAVAATGMTTALLSDEEISSGNTFTAGAVDLGVDNQSYYNGNECDEVSPDVWEWVGDAGYPVPGTECTTSWAVDYDIEHNEAGESEIRRFFAFDDLKPGDWGEDTISLHVDNNDAFLCVDVTLQSDDDNGCTEPEAGDGDLTCGDPDNPGDGEGELADEIIFAWWADDGDNVYESDETLLPAGPLGALGVGETATIALADSQQNIWNEALAPGPAPGDETLYIGKAWCFGAMTPDPVTQDGEIDGSVNNPSLDPGFDCNGAPLDNETQTDSATLDISFQAVQARHNGDFFCTPQPTRTTLTVEKIVVNDDGGTSVVSDFTLTVDGGVGDVTSGVATEVTPGTYNVTETGPAGYVLSYGGNCDSNGAVTIAEGEQLTCTLTNDDDDVGAITVDKIVAFSSTQIAGVDVTDFALYLDDGSNPPFLITDEIKVTGLAPGTYTVSEVYSEDPGGIIYDAQFTGACTDIGDTGTINLAADDDLTCTITNVVSVDPAS